MSETPQLSNYEKAFAKSDKTDAILLVDGKKLHVNKALLSYHSDYFNTLFNSEFKEKSMEEIEIKDVEFEIFAILLSLVHENPFEITWFKAERLLELADRFLLNSAKTHLEFFIKHSNEFGRYEKLSLADKYNLENLLEHALGFQTKMTETPDLSIYEEAFVKSEKTDAILVVDGKKLHVNKAILSYHSDYFNVLFNSDFKEKSMEEIPIEDVESEDFATLLSLVHDKPLRINSNNAPNLLKLADRFQMHTPKMLVENFLIISTDFLKIQKLFFADRYNLEDLFDHAMGLYDSRAEFLDFYWNSEILKDFSDATKARLFEKLVKDHGETF